jgi:hypothetical protein
MDDDELRNAIKNYPNKLIFLFNGSWEVLFEDKDNKRPALNGESCKVIAPVHRSQPLRVPAPPEIVLPVTIDIQGSNSRFNFMNAQWLAPLRKKSFQSK